ncbi:MAG: nicotinate-nucleotide adenylyltransferase [Actinomycetota bacterium]|nr:nicotinate-nucleotide adenylyltransferase [Actinomycetota bacterium]
MSRVGIFGGTFDPIHQGHMVIAEQVAEVLGLARVIFVPSGVPPHKPASSIKAGTEDRLRMVEAAIRGNNKFLVDSVEIESRKAMYSVETVPLIKERHEGDEWFFVSGADEVSNLLYWKEPDKLLEEAAMVAATRPGYDISNLEHLKEELENFDKIVPVECTRVDISATSIRRRLVEGRGIRYLVPDGVYEVIHERGLYGAYMKRRKKARERSDV